MKLLVLRYNSDVDHTNSVFLINGKYQCDGLEDDFRADKVMCETRVPDGIYPVEFRAEGGHHWRYLKRYGGEFHKGMLHIKNVPNFKYILIHCGNTDEDTAGCYLVGYTPDNDQNYISQSRKAYRKIYPIIRNALLRGEEVTIEFKTIDNATKIAA